jgi:hypothetical protein
MKFKIEKCKIMHIESKNKHARYPIEGNELVSTEEEKTLELFLLKISKWPISVQQPKEIRYWV